MKTVKSQDQLPLASKPATGQDSAPSLSDLLKSIDHARRILAPRAKKEDGQLTIQDLEKVVASLQAMRLECVVAALEKTRDALVASRQQALENRREQLERRAKAADWPMRRLQKEDRVGCFRLRYKGEGVTISLGSEVVETIKEVDGDRLFTRLGEVKAQLDAFPFDRTRFFRNLKAALSLARTHGKDRDGRVLVRDLYPFAVLAVQSIDDGFIKRPARSSFTEYTMAQFVYDLARFGREGWVTDGGERLSNQPPNMASITRGDSVTLPSLSGGSDNGPQLCLLYVQKA